MQTLEGHPVLVAIVGPTATGKSALAIEPSADGVVMAAAHAQLHTPCAPPAPYSIHTL